MRPKKKDPRKQREVTVKSKSSAVGHQSSSSAADLSLPVPKRSVRPPVKRPSQSTSNDSVTGCGKFTESDFDDKEAPKTQKEYVCTRQVFNNWSRYERSLSDGSEDEQCSSTSASLAVRGIAFDDALNASKSIGVGGQFRFRDEQDWNESIDTVTATKQFGATSLDIHEMAMSMSCIPLHKRLNIDESYFTPEVVEMFEIDARVHQSACESARPQKMEIPTVVDTMKTADNKVPITHLIDEELDALLTLSGSSINRPPTSTTLPKVSLKLERGSCVSVKQETQNLEDWLDSVILD